MSIPLGVSSRPTDTDPVFVAGSGCGIFLNIRDPGIFAIALYSTLYSVHYVKGTLYIAQKINIILVRSKEKLYDERADG